MSKKEGEETETIFKKCLLRWGKEKRVEEAQKEQDTKNNKENYNRLFKEYKTIEPSIKNLGEFYKRPVMVGVNTFFHLDAVVITYDSSDPTLKHNLKCPCCQKTLSYEFGDKNLKKYAEINHLHSTCGDLHIWRCECGYKYAIIIECGSSNKIPM